MRFVRFSDSCLVGISFRKSSGTNYMAKPILCSSQILLSSSFVTPTKASLTSVPTQALIVSRIATKPVRAAKQVASTCFGQILAISTEKGRTSRQLEKIPTTD